MNWGGGWGSGLTSTAAAVKLQDSREMMVARVWEGVIILMSDEGSRADSTARCFWVFFLSLMATVGTTGFGEKKTIRQVFFFFVK